MYTESFNDIAQIISILTPNKFVNSQNTLPYSKTYFVAKKLVLIDSFKYTKIYTKINQNQIWYNKFNQYAFKAANSPSHNKNFYFYKSI